MFWEGFLVGLKYGGIASGVVLCLFVVGEILAFFGLAVKIAKELLADRIENNDK